MKIEYQLYLIMFWIIVFSLMDSFEMKKIRKEIKKLEMKL